MVALTYANSAEKAAETARAAEAHHPKTFFTID
jgi:hypothetical protein